MGRTYKTHPDPHFDDDLFSDELDEDFDFDDDIDLYLNNQTTKNAARSAKGKRSGRYKDDAGAYGSSHRLPSDWEDFDYTSDSQYQDD